MDKTRTILIASFLMVTNCIVGQPLDEKNTSGPLTPDNFPYYAKLDDRYELRWNVNSTHIIFQTKVKTKGYVGFGVSEHGSMFPADVIIAWVKDGEVHFKDRYTSGHVMPTVDPHQDWHLISGSEVDEYTTVTMIRLLETCDNHDIAIKAGTTKIIYSYSPMDPSSDNVIFYHGFTRGTKSLLLLDPPANGKSKKNLPDDVTTIDFLNINYAVPSADTTYSCELIKLQKLKGKHHIIRVEPVIQKGNEKHVHHMVLYYCKNPIDDSLAGKRYKCYDDVQPQGVDVNCEHMFLAWAIGGTAFDFPSNVGFSLGNADDPVYFRLETHYDNPEMRNDIVDNSGLRLYLTEQIRQHDAGMLAVGLNVDSYQIIPPHFESFLSTGHCSVDCLEEALGDNEIHVFGGVLHSHLLGRKLSTRHVRNGTELPPILEDNNYDFDYQEVRLLPEERTIQKGDAILTNCVYDSSKRNKITYGGLSTRNEMCISFLLYYPKIALSTCFSRPTYRLKDQRYIWSVVQNMDFTKQSVREKFAELIFDKYISVCLAHDEYTFGIMSTAYVKHPYVLDNQCLKT